MAPPTPRFAALTIGLGIVLGACTSVPNPRSTASPGSPTIPIATDGQMPAPTPAAAAARTPPAIEAAVNRIEHCAGTATSGSGTSVPRDSTWAGYIAARPPGTFSCVEAAWLEPDVACGAAEAAAGFWVGIGGYTSEDLGIVDNVHALQRAGTGVECEDGEADHYAWHQVAPRQARDKPFAPGPGRTGEMAIAPGDHMWAQVRFEDGTFKMTVANLSTGDVRSATSTGGGGHRSSAEWVVGGEPGEPLARFSSVTFSGGLSTMDGRLGPIGAAAWRRNEVDEWFGGVRRLRVSRLADDGTSFRVTWLHH